MKERVSAFLREHELLQAGGTVLAGVSGGADSVCLLLLLKELEPETGTRVAAVHVNHSIRGESADADEAFVRALCERIRVPLTVRTVDVPALAKDRGLSLEEAGREARLRVFAEEAARLGCSAAAVAHHRDDAAETVLMNLLRGCGPEGLTGLRPKRPLPPTEAVAAPGVMLIRPLLCVTKREIAAWLEARGEIWREDETNAEPGAFRNRIRLEALPLLEEIRPGAAENILRLSELAEETAGFLERAAGEVFARALEEASGASAADAMPEAPGTVALDVKRLREADPALLPYVIRTALAEFRGDLHDISSAHIDAVRGLILRDTDGAADLPGTRVRRTGGKIVFAPPEPRGRTAEHLETDPRLAAALPNMGFTVRDRLPGEIFPENPYTKCFDYDKISQNIVIRRRLPGDFLEVNGGTKLLRRWFIDEKVPAGVRADVPLLADGSHVMWIVGGRMSDRYKVGPDTRRILEARLTERETVSGSGPEATSPSVKEQ